MGMAVRAHWKPIHGGLITMNIFSLPGFIQAAPGDPFGYESHDGPEDKCLGPPEDPCKHPTLGDMFAHPHPTHFNDSYASGVLGPGFIVALLLLLLLLLLRRGWGFVSPAALHVRFPLLLFC